MKTGQITYAVRTTMIDGMEIQEGDIMGLGDHGMLAVGKSVEKTAVEALKKMVDRDTELISVYYGCDVAEEEAGRVLEQMQEACPECEIELHSGGQPIYYYLISVE